MATKPPFAFPREFSFPPFFTRQTNLTTHHAQLVKWSSLILAYCRHHRLFKLSLSPSSSSSAPSGDPTSQPSDIHPGADELFHNRRIDKRLSQEDIRETVEFMRKDGRAEYVSSPTGGGGDVVWVYWRTPEEWASLVADWVGETGQKGAVLTLYELTESDATRGAGTYTRTFHKLGDGPAGRDDLVGKQGIAVTNEGRETDFHGLDPDLLQKALGILVKRGKAQIFGQEDSQGVKFF